MKVCIYVSNSLRKDPRVIKQVESAILKGYRVHFLGHRDKDYNQAFLNELNCMVSIVDLGEDYVGKLNSVFKKIYRQFMFFFVPFRLILKCKPDLIHANDFDTLIQSYIASLICKCPIIYDSHEINSENAGITESWIRKKYTVFFEKLIVPRVNAVVSVSNAAAHYFQEKYNIKPPIVVTNCPWKYEGDLNSKKSSKHFEALYQGKMIGGRGYEEFVESAKYFDNNVLAVIRGYGTIENSLRKIIAEKGLSKKVRFDEPVEIKEIIPKATCSHLGVVLTKPVNLNFKLTVSNKIFEYIQAGLPVIMSDVPEHKYLNERYNFGVIIKDLTPENIAKNINELALDNHKYNQLRTNAIKAAECLHWENESQKLLQLYKSLSP